MNNTKLTELVDLVDKNAHDANLVWSAIKKNYEKTILELEIENERLSKLLEEKDDQIEHLKNAKWRKIYT